MASPVLSVLSLCSGIGGIEQGLRLAGVPTRVVAMCERDPFAAALLLERMEDESLEPAPVWCGDLADLDAGFFAGVDLVTAGYPCQPDSAAGLKLGTEDSRWIWPAIAGILGVVRPRYVLLENVDAHLGRGFRLVTADLARLGFDAEWLLVRAADAGAPHIRRRLFCLAHRHEPGCLVLGRQPADDGHSRHHALGPGSASLAYTPSPSDGAITGGEHRPPSADQPERPERVGRGGEAVAHTGRISADGDEHEAGSCRCSPDAIGWTLPSPLPKSDFDAWETRFSRPKLPSPYESSPVGSVA